MLAAGDPRGELIALDLHPSPADRAWWVQRRAALAARLGDELAARAGRRIHDTTLRELGPDDVRSRAAALNGLLELRGMSREDFGNPPGWLELEQLVTLLLGSAWRTGASITWS